MSDFEHLGRRGESTEGRIEYGERNLREHLDLRLQFAEALARAQHIPLLQAVRRYTDVYNQLHIGGRPAVLPPDVAERRAQFESAFAATEDDHERVMQLMVDRYKSRSERQIDLVMLGNFSYEFDEKTKSIEMHFVSRPDLMVRAADDSPSALSAASVEKTKSDLADMFRYIRRTHPDAVRVEGRSWLYNIEAYRRLFPPEYVATHTVEEVDGGQTPTPSTWGQFSDRKGNLNHERAQQFLDNMQKLDPEHPQRAFPLQPLSVKAPIEHFYRFYGIE
jgi:hypothetical protein